MPTLTQERMKELCDKYPEESEQIVQKFHSAQIAMSAFAKKLHQDGIDAAEIGKVLAIFMETAPFAMSIELLRAKIPNTEIPLIMRPIEQVVKHS